MNNEGTFEVDTATNANTAVCTWVGSVSQLLEGERNSNQRPGFLHVCNTRQVLIPLRSL